MAALVHAYKKYGVKPSIIHWLLTKSETIHMYKDCLSKYFRLYWEGKYLLNKIQEGKIIKDDTTYMVVYSKNCTRGHILANPNIQYSVSFRQAAEDFDLPAYCYVSLANVREWN